MKFLKLAALAAVMLVGAFEARAQTQTWDTKYNSGKYFAGRSVATSATIPSILPIREPSRKVVAWVSATTPVSATVSRVLSNGVVLDTQTIAVGTTPVSVTYDAPQPNQGLLISRTTALSGANALHQVVTQTE